MSYNLLKFYWLFILLLFFNICSFAQNNNADTKDSVVYSAGEDSLNDDYENTGDTLVIRTIFDDANDSIVKWKQSRDFNYMVYLDSLLRKNKGLKKDTLNIDGGVTRNRSSRLSESPGNSSSFLNSAPVRFFLWLLAIFFIGFIVYKLFFTGGLFTKNRRIDDKDITEKEPESLSDYSQYSTLIHEAELKKDFNLASRYLYLQSLKKLAENELIVFSPDKTNNLYVQDLSGRSYQQDFSYLTLNYEYIWYGRFTINEPQYKKLKEQFILFNSKV